MLYRETVEGHTFSLLNELMSLDFLADFALVGGTALSLLLGHRKSIDIDLFDITSFPVPTLQKKLKNHFGNRIDIHSSEKNRLGVFCHLENSKLDLCKHPFALLNPVQYIDGIRMWSLEDIAASKVYAISARATKKDFWDINILLDNFTLLEISDFYYRRYNQVLAISVAKKLTYFDEAEDTDPPMCLQQKDWVMIKKSISKKINNQLK